MSLQRAGQYLFVLYCTTVGVALVLLPWSPGWERLVTALPFDLLFLLRPAVRGAMSGFGFVHLVWGTYELRDFLAHRLEMAARPPARSDAPATAPDGDP